MSPATPFPRIHGIGCAHLLLGSHRPSGFDLSVNNVTHLVATPDVVPTDFSPLPTTTLQHGVMGEMGGAPRARTHRKTTAIP